MDYSEITIGGTVTAIDFDETPVVMTLVAREANCPIWTSPDCTDPNMVEVYTEPAEQKDRFLLVGRASSPLSDLDKWCEKARTCQEHWPRDTRNGAPGI